MNGCERMTGTVRLRSVCHAQNKDTTLHAQTRGPTYLVGVAVGAVGRMVGTLCGWITEEGMREGWKDGMEE